MSTCLLAAVWLGGGHFFHYPAHPLDPLDLFLLPILNSPGRELKHLGPDNPGMADEAHNPGAVAQFLRAIGGWTAPSGRGLFMFRMMTVSCTASAFSGTASAFLSAWLFHLGGLGFAIGSCLGFCLGTLYYWKHTMRESTAAYRHFPTLMLLHLRRNFPTFGFEQYRVEAGGERGRREMERFDARFRGEYRLRCLMMSAYMTAGQGIEEINARREARMIDRLADTEMEAEAEGDEEEVIDQQHPPLETMKIY